MSKIKLESEYDDLDKYENYLGDIYYYKKNTHIFHNPYGPAVIWKGGIIFYYINNKALSKEEFEVHPERLKYLGKGHLICLG